jgi:threonine dehydrogenase-like Zn-dependent dehydrogenase
MPIRCPHRPNLGLSAPGGFAERVAAHQSQLFALPHEMPLEHGARVEPLAVALRAIAEAEVRPGDNTIVFGVGPIGLHLVRALRALGSGNIIAVGRSSIGRKEAAAASGANAVLDSREADVAEYVHERGLEITQAFECSGDSQALVTLSRAVRVGGTMAAVAFGRAPAALDTHTFVSKGQRLVSACAFGPEDFARALEMIRTGAVDVGPLISERVSLAEGPDAFVRLQRPGRLVSVLVEPWR